jgi:hypothetical protein
MWSAIKAERMAVTDLPRPLADRLRPRQLDEFVGQAHLLAPGKPLRVAIERGQAHSMVSVGTARRRQNYAGAPVGRGRSGRIYPAVGGYGRGARGAGGGGAGASAVAGTAAPHRAVRGRSPPL